MDVSLLSILPEWGVLGAFIAVVFGLVAVFMGYIKDRDDIISDLYRESSVKQLQSEEKMERVTNKFMEALKSYLEVIKDLEIQIKILSSKL